MDKDREERVKAETALLFMQDMARHIDARQEVVHKTMRPIRERGLRDHFFAEAEALIRGTDNDVGNTQ